MALPVMDRFSSPHYRWISRAKIFVLGVKYDACETCKIRTATDMRIGCCEREQTRNAGVGAAVASLTRHHRPLLHRRRRQSNMEKDACRRSGASQTRSMAWCEVRWSEREAARLDLRAFAANPAPAAGPR